MLKINDTLPKFEIQTDNIEFKVSDHQYKNIVVFFFPRADTSGCTTESIAFTNLQKDFDSANCIVIGISKDITTFVTTFTKLVFDITAIL